MANMIHKRAILRMGGIYLQTKTFELKKEV
jgi:hypothetical protein